MAIAIPQTIQTLTASVATYYTVTATTNVVGNIKEIILSNYTGTDRNVTVYFVPVSGSAAGSNTVISAGTVSASTLVRLPFNTFLEASATVQAVCSAASAVNFLVSPLEFGPTPVPILKPQTPALLGTGVSTYYTVTTGSVGNLKEILLCNTDTTARTVNLYFNGNSSANVISTVVSIAASTLVRIPFNTYLPAAGTIQAFADSASKVSIRVSAVEYV